MISWPVSDSSNLRIYLADMERCREATMKYGNMVLHLVLHGLVVSIMRMEAYLVYLPISVGRLSAMDVESGCCDRR